MSRLDNLKANMALNNLDVNAVPLVFQYKRDLPNVSTKPWTIELAFGASAVTGKVLRRAGEHHRNAVQCRRAASPGQPKPAVARPLFAELVAAPPVPEPAPALNRNPPGGDVDVER